MGWPRCFLPCLLTPFLFLPDSSIRSWAAEPEQARLILGFEPEEFEAKRGKFFGATKRVEGGFNVFAWFETDNFDLTKPTVGNKAWTWAIRSADRSEGRHALQGNMRPAGRGLTHKKSVALARFMKSLQKPPDLAHHYPVPGRVESTYIFRTFQWLTAAPAELRDWSGFNHLLIDVKLTAAATIRVSLEDDFIEPPVVASFKVPAGEWKTLRVDLVEAVRVRKLNLKEIVNICLLANPDAAGVFRIDNIRLMKGKPKSKFGLLENQSPFALPPAQMPEKPARPIRPANFTPDRSPLAFSPPLRIGAGWMTPFGWITALDNQRIFLAYTIKARNVMRPSKTRAIYTMDGGKTWRMDQPPAVRNLDHGTSRGWATDAFGSGAALSSGYGCVGMGRPSPRQFLTRYRFTSDGWEARLPPSILDSDIRHCGSSGSIHRLWHGPKAGRLWAAWGTIDRRRSLSIHAKFSDDSGGTWHPWGIGARIPGSRESSFSANTYSYQQPRIAEYGDHVACIWQDRRGLLWSRFDGKTWSPVEAIDAKAKVVLAVTPSESFRTPGCAVTRNRNEIFVTAWNVPGVLRWDGKRWHRELIDAADAGALSVCGEQIFLFTTGHVPELPQKKRLYVVRDTPVLCYRRDAEGKWHGPFNLSAGGKTKLVEYRQIVSLAAPSHSPPNFVPVAWSGENDLVMMRVPASINASAPPDWKAVKRELKPPTLALIRPPKAPKIDGTLEGVWEHAQLLTFRDLFGGAWPRERTRAYVLFDDEALYIAAECLESKLDALVAQKVPHDFPQLWKQDTVEVFLDPNEGSGSYYQLIVGAAGSVTDLSWRDGKRDLAWNSDCRAAVKTDAKRKCWTLEVAIPFRSLKVDGKKWRFNLVRNRQSKRHDAPEVTAWSPTGTTSSQVPAQFGVLLLDDANNK